MGYRIDNSGLNAVLEHLCRQYRIYAPKLFAGGGAFSDTDQVRYGEISRAEEIVFNQKADYSFKEVLLPITQTLFYFTEDTVREPSAPEKGAIVFLRSCDLHAVKRLDEMYLSNGPEDYYYKRLRDRVKFVLMGCSQSFENCFCVSMGTNESHDYSMSVDAAEGGYRVDCKETEWNGLFQAEQASEEAVVPAFVTENSVTVSIPETLTQQVAKSKVWDEYDSRCINCGRCNFVCPTCTCFTMQDLFYTDNGRVGERRRVWASCMVDGFTEVAGGGCYRKKNGERMRFKVLHKTLDFRERTGYNMCVGCGRCDDICPEYISFSNCINKLEKAVTEVSGHDAE